MICSVCLSIFSQDPESPSRAPTSQIAHQQSLSSLQQSANAKCPICSRLFTLISEGKLNIDTEFSLGSKSDNLDQRSPPQPNAGANFRGMECSFSTTSDAYQTPCVGFQMCSGEHVTDLYLLSSHEGRRHGEFSQRLSTTTESMETLNFAQKWLHTCLTSHKICSGLGSSKFSRTTSPDSYPSRLVHITSTGKCYLLNSSFFPSDLQYLALSHCWGSEKFFSLSTTNLDLLKENIPLGSLSPVFQDALSVTLKLGYNFIWIDSLCIIQDSKEDWKIESARMGSIYKNSMCTLAATGFPDGSYGLFATRDPALVLPFEIKAHWQSPATTDNETIKLFGIFPNMWNEEIESSPLYQRAWVVQERVLSPRILHFTKSQIYWECCEMQCSEVYPQGVFTKHRFGSMGGGQYVPFRSKTYSLFSGLSQYGHMEESFPEAFHLGFMNAIIRAHSRSKLTFPSDKLMSLAGIANELQNVFGESCIAGMFQKQLPHSLLWTASSPSVRRSEYGAPTWSWISLDSPINPWLGVKFSDPDLNYKINPSIGPMLARVTEIETIPAIENQGGPLSATRLTVQGELFRFTSSGQALLTSLECQPSSSPPHSVKIDSYRSLSVIPDITKFYTIVKEENNSTQIYFLPLIGGELRHDDKPSTEGLILLQSEQSNNEFQRLGYMSIIFVRKEREQYHTLGTNDWWNGVFIDGFDSSVHVI